MPRLPRKRWKPLPLATDDPLAPVVRLLAQISFDELLKEQATPPTEQEEPPDAA